MPDFPIVDAHLHLWDPRRFRMTWVDGNPTLERPYDLADYRRATAGVAVAAMVYVQVEVEPAYGLLEPRWVAERAAADPRLQAMVAWAPVEHGDPVRSYLEALVAVTPLVRGVRQVTQGHPDADFCLRPRFVQAVRALPELGLSFDLCIDHRQLGSVVRLVERCPDTSFVLDHLGKPDVRGGVLEPWRRELRELASFPNVVCKVSGVVTEADHARWTPSDLVPYVEHALEVFGEDRVLFGGDWPVVLLASSYERWVRTLERLTSGLSAAARRKLWSDNARRVYRLPA